MGINAEGLGRDHWNEMLAYPRKPIAHWHSLVEVKKSFKEVGEGAPGPHVCCMAACWRMAGGCCEASVGPSRGARGRALLPQRSRQRGKEGRWWGAAWQKASDAEHLKSNTEF